MTVRDNLAMFGLSARIAGSIAREGFGLAVRLDSAEAAPQPLHAFAFGVFTLGGSLLEPKLQPKDYVLAAIGRISQTVDDLGTLHALV